MRGDGELVVDDGRDGDDLFDGLVIPAGRRGRMDRVCCAICRRRDALRAEPARFDMERFGWMPEMVACSKSIHLLTPAMHILFTPVEAVMSDRRSALSQSASSKDISL